MNLKLKEELRTKDILDRLTEMWMIFASLKLDEITSGVIKHLHVFSQELFSVLSNYDLISKNKTMKWILE